MKPETITLKIKGVTHIIEGNELTSAIQMAILFLKRLETSQAGVALLKKLDEEEREF
jgi:hypothetical protein